MLIPALAAASVQISFDRDIRPILAERCLKCHGEKKQSGGLRLDAKAFAMRGGQNGPVIVPGKALESRLYQRIVAENDDQRMPPAGERLSAAQVALLKSWIDAGAVWPESDGATGRQGDGASDRSQHWAWQPIKRPEIPPTPATIRNPQSATRNPQPAIRNPQSAIRNPQPAIRNPQSATRNPQSAIRNPQSAIRNPQSATRNPQSAIRNPQSATRNPQSAIRNPQSAIPLMHSSQPGSRRPASRCRRRQTAAR